LHNFLSIHITITRKKNVYGTLLILSHYTSRTESHITVAQQSLLTSIVYTNTLLDEFKVLTPKVVAGSVYEMDHWDRWILFRWASC